RFRNLYWCAYATQWIALENPIADLRRVREHLREPCLDDTRCNSVDANSLTAKLLGKLLREHDQCSLGDVVDTEPERWRDSADRGDIDDAAPSALHVRRHDHFRERKHSTQVDFECLVPHPKVG